MVSHPVLQQDCNVQEFLEREEVVSISVQSAPLYQFFRTILFITVCVSSYQLPRAVNTQALSGSGFLKMINKASDAVNKMTVKMNESDNVRNLCKRRSNLGFALC